MLLCRAPCPPPGRGNPQAILRQSSGNPQPILTQSRGACRIVMDVVTQQPGGQAEALGWVVAYHQSTLGTIPGRRDGGACSGAAAREEDTT